jgi:hypothetical protein
MARLSSLLTARKPSQSAELKREIANFVRTHRNGYQLLHHYMASVPPDEPNPFWRGFGEALKKSLKDAQE